METTTKSAPTGCFKCGRPGHWSRDCPSSAPDSNNLSSSSAFPQNPNTNNNNNNNFQRSSAAAAAPKAPKKRATRPKLTPEMLLSDDGLGYVLRYFPRSFKYRGRGREVSDLGNLIRLYSEWHSRLLPYYSFDQFVRKVEQVAATKRVKICIKELRERVASGGDPTKLYDNPAEHSVPCDDQGILELDQPSHDPVNISSRSVDADSFQEVMLNEIYDNAMDETHQRVQREASGADRNPDTPCHRKEPSNDEANKATSSKSIELTEEQRARMEANKLKALERARGITEEQRARMEANRLKALERAKARSKMLQSA